MCHVDAPEFIQIAPGWAGRAGACLCAFTVETLDQQLAAIYHLIMLECGRMWFVFVDLSQLIVAM